MRTVSCCCCHPQVLSTFKGAALEGCHYTHPLYERVSPLVIGGDYITTDSGTGLVHTAPGHGQEDYQVCAAGTMGFESVVHQSALALTHCLACAAVLCCAVLRSVCGTGCPCCRLWMMLAASQTRQGLALQVRAVAGLVS